ncbi:hypothetical protein RND81_01G188500 [Saponaria officinalis]|uniref:Hydrophobic seed protein domain-containing protein n=1 Tax=Saponaria officinalis TaxID=3572 RepID=A0AAW1NH94_SAPOF
MVTRPTTQCYTLLQGIAEVEAAACLCTAFKARIFGLVKVKVKVKLPIAVSLLLNGCGKKIPPMHFNCLKH